MGHRLSRIYTRTGDQGTTGLGDGSRLDKDDPRIEAIGAVDELNAGLGLLLAEPDLPGCIAGPVQAVQHRLFDLGAELCLPGRQGLDGALTTELEQTLDRLNADLPPLREFVLPGGNRPAALCHLCRTLCRRAERRLVTLARGSDVNPHSLAYLNRLSDLLFVMARHLARRDGGREVLWQKQSQDPDRT